MLWHRCGEFRIAADVDCRRRPRYGTRSWIRHGSLEKTTVVSARRSSSHDNVTVRLQRRCRAHVISVLLRVLVIYRATTPSRTPLDGRQHLTSASWQAGHADLMLAVSVVLASHLEENQLARALLFQMPTCLIKLEAAPLVLDVARCEQDQHVVTVDNGVRTSLDTKKLVI